MSQVKMELLLQVSTGDITRPVLSEWYSPIYEGQFETVISIGTTLTEIKTHLSVIELVVIRVDTDNVTLEVHKDRSPEYWQVDGLFIAKDVAIEVLSLRASAAAEVYVYLGGQT